MQDKDDNKLIKLHQSKPAKSEFKSNLPKGYLVTFNWLDPKTQDDMEHTYFPEDPMISLSLRGIKFLIANIVNLLKHLLATYPNSHNLIKAELTEILNKLNDK